MIGKILNGILIEEEIAISTTGVVYKGKDVGLNVPRAIKILYPIYTKQEYMKNRFKETIKLWAKLEYPNFVHIFGAIEEDDILGIIMDYVEGNTLKELIKKDKQLGISQAIDYFLQLAKALSFAHKKGILHRKLSPFNIKVLKDESLKIMGLSQLLDLNNKSITPSNIKIGKMKYMAPEQFEGEYTIYTDQYNLGIILYEMLVGRPPFIGKNLKEFYRLHLEAIPEKPSRLNKNISKELDNIILKMISKKPEDRFKNLDEVISALMEATDRVDVKEDLNIHSLMYRGRRALEHRKPESAIYFFNKVLSLYGKSSEYFEEALEKREKAYYIYKEEEKIREMRDLILDALYHFDESEEEEKDDEEREEEREKAKEIVKKILFMMRDYPDSTRMLGLKMDLKKEMPDILEESIKELEREIKESEKLVKQGKAFLEEEKYEEAIKSFEEALEWDNKNKEAEILIRKTKKKLKIVNLSKFLKEGLISLKEDKNFIRAIKFFNKCLELDPENEKIKEFLKKAKEEEEKRKKREKEIEKLFKEGKKLYDKWEYTQALAKFKKVIELDKNHKEASKFLNIIEERLQEDNKIEDISFFYNKGVEFFNEKKWKEAVACFKRVLKVMSTHKKALEYKTLAEQELEKEEIFNQVYEDAMLFFEENRYQEALERFDYLLKLDNNNEEIKKYKKLCLEFLQEKDNIS